MTLLEEMLSYFQKMKEDETEILTADCIKYLGEMTTSQLTTIYKNGKRKVKIENSPAAYEALNKMTTSQLEAIFGPDMA